MLLHALKARLIINTQITTLILFLRLIQDSLIFWVYQAFLMPFCVGFTENSIESSDSK
ncbi:hypothetical protein HCCG_01618 [Helicobacter cinaedi CCUG 18818 = ATCC BAA-847]|uniref:Uncharacterized protein n=1 Tax=Helicobacter cinaedi CCUG 18818 = ATCC BAA-847 TaxID=537971 RepID=A0ABN0BBS1_9HELI|nr:hypothetical protein HCCG_01618 [Helicobacter cinaedi CCUG 18818 = ATCC BAA-847]